MITVQRLTERCRPFTTSGRATVLRGSADEGGTVLLSSHLLAEIGRVADEIIIVAAAVWLD